jgi:hypothetical protein
LFDRVHFRLANSYAVGDTPTEIQITAQYAHKNGWKPLEIQDNTLGLKTSGGIKFKVPADWKTHTAATIESGSWTGPVPADSSEETTEVTRFTATNSDKNRYGGNYVALFQATDGDTAASTSQNMFVFWFNDGNDSQPSVSGADTFVEVDLSSASTKAAIATALRDAIISVDDGRFVVGALDTSGSDPFFDVTQVITGDTQNATSTSDFTVAIQTQGVSNLEDPDALWDFSAYAILINFNVKAAATNNIVKNIWPYSNSHSQQIRVVDPHHVSLNDIAIAQSISFNRSGKFVNMEDRFGKTEIRKLGASGGVVTFGSVDLGER